MQRKITICMGSSCFARGNEKNLKIIRQFIAANHIEANVTLVGTRCIGECENGPNIRIDDELYRHMSGEALIDLLNREFLNKNQDAQ